MQQHEAFEDLKTALSSYPVLCYFREELETRRLKSESSEYAMGAVLAQVDSGMEHVVAYGSKSFSPQ